MRIAIALLAVGLHCIPSTGSAQTAGPRLVRLTKPDHILGVDFSHVAGVSELPDGRVLVSDRVEERVVAADLATGRTVQVGRAGSGPGEYRMPSRLVRWRGDSTLLVDEGNGRLAVIAPDLRITRSFTLQLPGLPTTSAPRALDRQGRLYFQVPRWAAASFGRHGDSVPVLRLTEPENKVEVITWVLVAADPPGQRQYGLPFVPYSPQDVWGVTPTGQLAVARSGDYHVEWLVDGRLTRGPHVAYRSTPVTHDDKIRYVRHFLENSGIGGRGGQGGSPTGMTPVPSEMTSQSSLERLATRNTFARTKPPFTDDAPFLSPDGQFWVHRSGPNGADFDWDVFDGQGRLVSRVSLPAGRALVAVGGGGVYAVVSDENGVERLERYPAR